MQINRAKKQIRTALKEVKLAGGIISTFTTPCHLLPISKSRSNKSCTECFCLWECKTKHLRPIPFLWSSVPCDIHEIKRSGILMQIQFNLTFIRRWSLLSSKFFQARSLQFLLASIPLDPDSSFGPGAPCSPLTPFAPVGPGGPWGPVFEK